VQKCEKEVRMARLPRPIRPVVWTLAGAALAYFYDPENGRGRRIRLKDQLGARLRGARGAAERKVRYAESTAAGKVQAVLKADRTPPEDDRTLVDKIKSEVLGSPQFASQKVLVDAADGVVTLRGELANAGLVDDLVKAVSAVPGVASVENLLHAPGEPAPNKEASREASG
jgi:hypothetical protein